MSFNPDLSCPWSLRASPLSHLFKVSFTQVNCVFSFSALTAAASALRRLPMHRAHLVCEVGVCSSGGGESRRVGDVVEGFDDFVPVLGRSRAPAVRDTRLRNVFTASEGSFTVGEVLLLRFPFSMTVARSAPSPSHSCMVPSP